MKKSTDKVHAEKDEKRQVSFSCNHFDTGKRIEGAKASQISAFKGPKAYRITLSFLYLVFHLSSKKN